MDQLIRLVTGAPVYVWPLLAVLVALGVMSTRDRETSLVPMLALPFLAVAGLPNLLAMPNQGVTWADWALAYAVGLAAGFALQARYLIAREGLRVHLRGEWVTFGAIMLIFWSSYALGVTNAIAPGRLAVPPLSIVFPALEGLGSGFFLGRVLRVLRT